MPKRIIRVFPTKTSMTPIDENVRINETPSFFDEADEVHISCLFSWDKQKAEKLADEAEEIAADIAEFAESLDEKAEDELDDISFDAMETVDTFDFSSADEL